MPDLQEEYNTFKAGIESLNNEIYDRESDFKQHAKVLTALRETDPKRKAKYMQHNVLVDMTVEEVIPRVEKMQNAIGKDLESTKAQLEVVERNLDNWKKDHNIKVIS